MNLLTEWISDLRQPGERIQTYTLLHRLCTHIHQTLSYRLREEPGVQTAGQTLSNGTGSCRDFALLFIEAARFLGLASRFVSGYLHAPPSTANMGATHAWAEVYLPGAGWKGFDPTIGEIAGTDHFAVAVARLPESVPPIAGSFVGTPGSSLEVGVWVTKGSLKNNFTFWTPMHPVWPRCENSEYPDIPAFSRLARRVPQRPKLRTYFIVNPKC